MLNIESKRAAEPKHRQQTRIERDGTDHCPSCTSSCNPSARHPRLEFGRNGQDANSCYAKLCSTVARPASRAPHGSLELSPSRSARRHARHARHAPSSQLDGLAILEEPVVSWEQAHPLPSASRPTVGWPGRTSIPSSLAIPTILVDAQTTRLSACYADACLPTSLVLDRPPPSSSNGDPGAETAPVAELSVSSTSGV